MFLGGSRKITIKEWDLWFQENVCFSIHKYYVNINNDECTADDDHKDSENISFS